MRDRYRPWLAAVLALLIAGLGHAYLRRWGRALLWFLTILGGVLALAQLYGFEPTGFPPEYPSEVAVPSLVLLLLSAVDAFLVGRDQNRTKRREAAAARAHAAREVAGDDAAGNGPLDGENGVLDGADVPLGETPEPQGDGQVSCPHCGKETDASLDFCHWCTEALPWADGDDPGRKA